MRKIVKLLTAIILVIVINMPALAMATSNDESSIDEMTKYIQSQMKKSKIQGLSIVFINHGNTIYKKNFGYADVEAGKKVTNDTLFELGSTSKAFTAMGIYILEEQGLINLDAKLSEYLPWFYMNYDKTKNDDITVRQCLHHTTGISTGTITLIKEINGDELEKTVHSLVGKKLEYKPGEHYEYATINYDILGLIIEKVSGQKFDKFMKAQVFDRCGMNNTYFRSDYSIPKKLAKGYRVSFMRAFEDNAPVYIGNAPAGYAVTNIIDMEKWIKLQISYYGSSSNIGKLLEKLREADTSVSSHGHDVPGYQSVRYASGWEKEDTKIGYFNSGNNPNYSSFEYFELENKKALAILCNAGSDTVEKMGYGILDILDGKEPAFHEDPLIVGDRNFTIISIALGLIDIIILIKIISERKKIILMAKLLNKNKIKICVLLLLIALFGILLYNLPTIVTGGMGWRFIVVWSTKAMALAAILFYLLIVLLLIKFILNKK
ncbi:hypothetical protein CF050_06800 [Clostridium botulinum]|uniref:serine hydrolase domain-containing protein n=1 Tax=Clostridium botulinum TaxID=1491 RepID=UPI0005F8B4F4|nr:serine hydrolase domain-containing protein [Clostridium botulinum]MBN3346593.1 hypothetical protein [Clostridium botulinum]